MRAPDRMREAVNVSERPFWDDEIETMTPDARRRLEDERLGEQIAYDYATSPYYRSKLDEAGVRPGDVRGVDDLAAIPFMEKTEVAASQADGTLLGVNQCAPLDRIVRIQATGGTTGQPIRIGLTRRDIEDYGEMGAGALWAEKSGSRFRGTSGSRSATTPLVLPTATSCHRTSPRAACSCDSA